MSLHKERSLACYLHNCELSVIVICSLLTHSVLCDPLLYISLDGQDEGNQEVEKQENEGRIEENLSISANLDNILGC
jgi:hypothetical protein